MKVIAQVVGGQRQEIEIADGSTVAALKTRMGASTYTATVNGEPENDSYVLQSLDFVSLAPAVKGA